MDFPFSSAFDFSIIEWIILAALLLFFIVQLLFYFLLYKKPYAHRTNKEKTSVSDDRLPLISVIIVSKNESEKLKKNLPAILEQDYPDFEVIVVNMGSADETEMILKAMERNHDNLYYTYIPQDAEPLNEKKLALTIGIKAAKNPFLLFTEAYCKPCSNQWIREFANEFAKGKEVVLGFCKLDIPHHVPLRKFILYDNLIQGLNYLSLGIVHSPFMGIGRNMGYTKDLFFRQKGFSAILNVEDGEDNLFINRVANGKNTGVVISPESMTVSDVVTSFSVWRTLKSKYLCTKQFYKGFPSSIFGWETFSKYGFYLAVIFAVFWGILHNTFFVLGIGALLFIVRYCFQMMIINRNSKHFDAGKYHIDLIFMDIFQPIHNVRFKQYAHNKRSNFRRS